MKMPPLPLLALTLLLGACSSPVPSAGHRPAPPTGPAIRADNKSTAWGELPSYDGEGHYFTNMRAPNAGGYPLDGQATLDLLVNPDGTVEEVEVFASSGDERFDRAVRAQFKKARYTLRLGPDDPAPYVVRLEIVLRTDSDPHQSRIPISVTNHSQMGPQPNFSGPPAPTYSGSTSNP